MFDGSERTDGLANRKSRLASIVLSGVGLLLVPPSLPAQESWDAIYFKGNKIGYVHTFIEKVSEKGRELYRVRLDQVFNFRRLDDNVTMKMMYGTIETADGEVLRLDTRTLASENEIRVYGDAIKGKMNLIMEVEGTGKRQEMTVPWGKDVRGPYAAEQSMARKPMTRAKYARSRCTYPTSTGWSISPSKPARWPRRSWEMDRSGRSARSSRSPCSMASRSRC